MQALLESLEVQSSSQQGNKNVCRVANSIGQDASSVISVLGCLFLWHIQ